MKNIFPFFAIILICSCSPMHQLKGVDYTVIPDDKAKVLKGLINRSILENDTAFSWFRENMKWVVSDDSTVSAFHDNKAKFSVLIFGGTWCEDTQNILPRFYKLSDLSGFPDHQITLVAVDRQKKSIRKLHEIYHITNVPTIIILQQGKEKGRVVEYGKTGSPEKELAAIVRALP